MASPISAGQSIGEIRITQNGIQQKPGFPMVITIGIQTEQDRSEKVADY